MPEIIFINTFTGYDRKNDLYNPGNDGFFKFGMGSFIAHEFHKRGIDIKFESWRMDTRIDHVMEKEIDGLNCRIFPSKRNKFFGEFSIKFLRALKQKAGDRSVVFHFMGVHRLDYHFYTMFLKENLVIATHLGGPNPLWRFKNYKKIQSLLFYWLERGIFSKNYDIIITICRAEIEYFSRIGLTAIHMPVFGIAMEELYTIKDRNSCRDRLGLPRDKKIVLQVGRATKERGFDWIIDILDKTKSCREYLFVFVGTYIEDEFYPKLKKYNVVLKNFVPRSDLVDYYNAADILFFLINTQLDLEFAGTAYVPLEALACGTPVVATSFHHFPGKEVQDVSRIPESKEDVLPMVEELNNANVSRERCREIVLKYFSWDIVAKKHSELYFMR